MKKTTVLDKTVTSCVNHKNAAKGVNPEEIKRKLIKVLEKRLFKSLGNRF